MPRRTPSSFDRLEPRRLLAGSFTFSVPASFDQAGGLAPDSALVMDAAGNVYGTTAGGGAAGNGTAFELPKAGNAVTALASFQGTTAAGGLAVDGAGNLYGTTTRGGSHNDGAVYEVPAGGGPMTTLASFDGTNGSSPTAGLVVDAGGNLFGTTPAGPGSPGGRATVFEVAKGSGAVTTLATFDPAASGGASPSNPAVSVIDSSGNLFGTTATGGPGGGGTVFELAKGSAALTTLAAFDGANGSQPNGLTRDSTGNLYGATFNGGPSNDGTVFEVPAGGGVLTTLAAFSGPDGIGPLGPLARDSSGNLFGTTSGGGTNGQGTVFEVLQGQSAVNTILSFDGANGSRPQAGLLLDPAGNFFGTASAGGNSGGGTLFQLTPGFSAPFATLAAPDITTAGGTTETVTAVYSCNAIDLSSITPANLSVTGPGGAPLTVTGVTTDPATGTPAIVTATYTIAAPGGAWSAANSGAYTVQLLANQVKDGRGVTASPVFTGFDVNIPPPQSDPTFAGGNNVPLAFTPQASVAQPDGKILIAGLAPGATPGGTQAVIERLTADGTHPDPTFGTGGTVIDAFTGSEAFYGLLVQPDGNIVVSGTSNGSLLVARYRPDGTPDPAFGSAGAGSPGRVAVAVADATDATGYGVALDPNNGNIVVAGGAGRRFVVQRFTTAGAPDPAFNGGAPLQFDADAPGAAHADVLGQVRVQGNGDIVVAGASGGAVVVARLTPDGVPDPTFGSGGLVMVDSLATRPFPNGQLDHTEGLALYPGPGSSGGASGSGAAAAQFILVANSTPVGDFGVVRLRAANGAVDKTFGAAGLAVADLGGADDADVLVVPPDQRIVAAGTSDTAGITRPALAAFAPDGTLDPRFGNAGTQTFDSGVTSTAGLAAAATGTAGAASPGTVRPQAEGLGTIIEAVFGGLQDNGQLLIGMNQAGSTGAPKSVTGTMRRVNVTGHDPLPTGTLAVSVNARLPVSVVAGARAGQTVSVVVNNPGDATVDGRVKATVYFSKFPSLTGATPVAMLTKDLKLRKGRSKTLPIKLSSYPLLPDGGYYLLAGVEAPDHSMTVVQGPVLEIASPFTSIQVLNVRPAKAAVSAGEPLNLGLTLHNAGNVPDVKTTTLTILASTASTGAEGQTVALVPLRINLKAGASRSYRVRFRFPTGLAAGSYYLVAKLDPPDGSAVSATPIIVS